MGIAQTFLVLLLILLATEALAAVVLAWIAWRRPPRATDFVTLTARRGAWSVIAGCVVAWLLDIQGAAIAQEGFARHPASDAAQGSFFITWDGRVMLAEIPVTVLLAAIYLWLRRMRIRRSH